MNTHSNACDDGMAAPSPATDIAAPASLAGDEQLLCEVLADLGTSVAMAADAESIAEALHRHVSRMIAAPSFFVAICDEAANSIEYVFAIHAGTRRVLGREQMADAKSLVAWSARQRQPVLLADADTGSGIVMSVGATLAPARSVLYVPMFTASRVLGVIGVQSESPNIYGPIQLARLSAVASVAMAAFDRAQLAARLTSVGIALAQAKEQLGAHESLASVGMLASGVAHEINNPASFAHAGAQVLAMDLERFRGFLLALAGEGAGPEVLASLNTHIDGLLGQVETIVDGTSRIRDLVRDLRTFSRQDTADRKLLAVGEGLLSTIRLVRTQYAPQVEICCELEADPVVECWPAQLNQVFMNLIVNACQAIVAQQSRQVDASRTKLCIRSRVVDAHLLIEVEDRAGGLPAGTVEHIFKPFYTTKEAGQGTGLGLAISADIVARHGGQILVRSVDGEGSCFTVRLPLPNGDGSRMPTSEG
jgi:signal transduction histidine kinase